MLEKEIKILDIDVEAVQEKLEIFGAKKTFDGFIHDVYYDFPGETMDENKRIFRVRKKGEVHLYTIKRKRNTKADWWEKWLKIADEGEREITNVESFSKVLEKYGMEKIREKKKHRISYSMGEVEFDIDTYDGIPPLLEIEAHTKEEILEWIKRLGLTYNEQKDFWSRKLFEYYGKEYSYLQSAESEE